MPIDVALLMSAGIMFHNFAVSMPKLSSPALVLAESFHILLELGLSQTYANTS